MGYRISLYIAKKEYLDKVTNISDDIACETILGQYDEESDEYNEGDLSFNKNAQELHWDCTNWINFDFINEYKKDELYSELFPNAPSLSIDYSFYRVNKKQFNTFIHMIKRIVDHFAEEDTIDVMDLFDIMDGYDKKTCTLKVDPNKKYKIESSMNDSKNILEGNGINKLFSMARSLNRINSIRRIYTKDDEWLDKVLDDKWNVTYDDTWYEALITLIYLYKTIDWDTYDMVFYGN